MAAENDQSGFSILLTFFGLLAVTFLIGRVIPIDPVLRHRRRPGAARRSMRACARNSLDEPLYYQFWLYVTKVLQGDFGKSVITSKPVIDDIIRFFPATIELATSATLLGVVIGVPMGVMAAKYQGAGGSYHPRARLVGYSVPVFWLGIVGLVCSTNGWSGPRAPAWMSSIRHHRSRHRHHADRRRPGAGVGHLLQRAQPSRAAGIDPRLLLARLHQPHDPQLHDRAAEPGICHGGAGERPVGVPRRLAHALGNAMCMVTVMPSATPRCWKAPC
jgi:hypothetical protein